MNKYFAGVKTVEELRKRYKELLKQNHPDNGGDEEVMKEINRQYDAVFANLSEEKSADSQSYSKEENEEFKAVLNAISGFNMTVQIIGEWIWAFDSYQYKDQLKAMGFHYAPRKKAWTWHREPYHRYCKKEVPLSRIKAKYGSRTVSSKSEQYAIN